MATSNRRTIKAATAVENNLIAAIDVGANMIRMTIAQVESNSRTFEVIEQLNRGVRLGQDTFCCNRISNESMRTAVSIFRDYKKLIDHYHVDHVRCVATTAVREAINADTFLDRIFMSTGMQVDILDPSEESHLILTSVRSLSHDPSIFEHDKVLIAEIGGGNTLLTVLENGRLDNAICVNSGTLRLREQFSSADILNTQYIQRLESYVSDVMFSAVGTLHLKNVNRFIVVGNDARIILSKRGITELTGSLTPLSVSDFEKFMAQCQSKSEYQISCDYQIPIEDAQRLIPASIIFRYLLQQTKQSKMYVSPATMREGLLICSAWSIARYEDRYWSADVIESARALGEKFLVDLVHAEKVAKLSLKIYDELTEIHGFKPQLRILMHVASLLHEAGLFVNSRAHHKHSYYLIANSDIFGLSRSDIEIVALVARYYRKSAPKSSHPMFMALSWENRVIVSKLASFLRVADAILQGCEGDPGEISLKLKNDELIISSSAGIDPQLTRTNLDMQGKLFEDIFGIRIILDVQ